MRVPFGVLMAALVVFSRAASGAPADTTPVATAPGSFVDSPCGASPGVPSGGTVYYIRPNGNDGNSGRSLADAFRTIRRAFQLRLHPGDVVMVAPGTYTETVDIKTPGASGACVTLMGLPGKKRPVIKWSDDGAATINVWASYVRISGLAVTHPEPNFRAASTDNSGNSAIDVYSVLQADANGVQRPRTHHVQIDNVIAYGSGCAGLTFENTDYAYVYGNTTFGNGFSDPAQCSGISLYESVNLDTAAGYHNLILNNYAYSNRNIQPVEGGSYTTDGNGIIIDDFRQTQRLKLDSGEQPVDRYTAQTLIFGNVVFGNGGHGITVFRSDAVDVINNISYSNVLDTKLRGYPECGGELHVNSSGGLHLVNNIVTAHDRKRYAIYQAGTPSDLASNLWTHNVAYLGMISLGYSTQGVFQSENRLGMNPQFFSPSTYPVGAKQNFHLGPQSPAIGAGLPTGLALPDSSGKFPAKNGVVDIGAFSH